MSACKDFKELDERTSGTGKKVAGGKKKEELMFENGMQHAASSLESQSVSKSRP